MDHLIYLNGSIVEADRAGIAPDLGGVLYGWGVFTTVGIFQGKAFAFDRHWERLSRHAEKARIQAPTDYGQAVAVLGELIKANGVKEGRARLTVLKESIGGWRAGPAGGAQLLIFTASGKLPSAPALALTLSPHRIFSQSPLAGVKQTSMVENLLALEEARQRDFTEAVMLNERGEITSATAANMFWIIGDEVFTPSPTTGCIAGVTRGLVVDMARRLKMHVVEGSFPIQRLHEAREVFLTSTTRGITVASRFDITEYDPKQAKMTAMIAREFQKLVRGDRI